MLIVEAKRDEIDDNEQCEENGNRYASVQYIVM